jgi:hypothetical protein
METIKEKNEISIDNKIFTNDDILNLMKLFVKQSNAILDKSKEIRHKNLIQEGWKESSIKERDTDLSNSKLVFTSSDNSIYSCTPEEILKENDVLENITVVEMNFYFFEHVFDSQFVFRIKYTASDSYSSSSFVSVEGQDKNWVNETTRLVHDFLSGCRSQSRFFSKFQTPVLVITIFLIDFFLYNLIKLFIRTNLSFPRMIDNMFGRHMISFILVSSLIAATPAIFIKEWLKKIFPRIEIQTGKTIQQIKKEKRRKLLIIASEILILSLLVFLLRRLLN